MLKIIFFKLKILIILYSAFFVNIFNNVFCGAKTFPTNTVKEFFYFIFYRRIIVFSIISIFPTVLLYNYFSQEDERLNLLPVLSFSNLASGFTFHTLSSNRM